MKMKENEYVILLALEAFTYSPRECYTKNTPLTWTAHKAVVLFTQIITCLQN